MTILLFLKLQQKSTKTKFFVSKVFNFVWRRVLHSEAYIRYIEGLTKESKSMCNWDRQLSTASEVREYSRVQR
jgi:hypothetical protein